MSMENLNENNIENEVPEIHEGSEETIKECSVCHGIPPLNTESCPACLGSGVEK